MHEDAALKLLSPTLVGVTNPATVALLPFVRSGVRALVHEAKYRDNPRAQAILAAVLAEYVSEIDTDAFGNTVLIPLPLSKGRLRERGFNQCERIASLALTNT